MISRRRFMQILSAAALAALAPVPAEPAGDCHCRNFDEVPDSACCAFDGSCDAFTPLECRMTVNGKTLVLFQDPNNPSHFSCKIPEGTLEVRLNPEMPLPA